MTLGGLAVAIGELVDDAIVGVEKRLSASAREAHSPEPKPALVVVYHASAEVRNSIVFQHGFSWCWCSFPLFRPERHGRPAVHAARVAYIVSILASLLVSLTVTPVLSYWLLPSAKIMEHDATVSAPLAQGAAGIRHPAEHPAAVVDSWVLWPAAVALSCVIVTQLGRDFLPPFNEGSVQVNVILPPGDSAGDLEPHCRDGRGSTLDDRRRGRLWTSQPAAPNSTSTPKA